MYFKTFLCFASLGLASLASAATPQSWQSWMDNYYQNPQPERVVDAAFGLAEQDAFQDRTFTATAIGFFSQVFARHPERVDGWFRQFQALPDSGQRAMAAALWYAGDARGETLLRRLASNSLYRGEIRQLVAQGPAPVAETPVLSESSMNLQWGAFLGSGEDAHITQILAAIGNDAVGSAARNALAFNAARHDRVLAICREQLDRQPNEVQSVLRAVIRDAERRPATSS